MTRGGGWRGPGHAGATPAARAPRIGHSQAGIAGRDGSELQSPGAISSFNPTLPCVVDAGCHVWTFKRAANIVISGGVGDSE